MMLGMKRICRVRIAKDELDKMSKEDLHKSWLLQEQYVDYVEAKLNENTDHSELMNLRESEEKLKQQQLEAIRKENILVMRLTTKEQEMQEYAGQIQELKQSQIPSIAQLRSALLDPAVNLMFDRMRREIDSLKARLEETQNELNAWKFTPDSGTGKRLMAKCRLLYQENEELGKMISSGRIAKLEGDLALQKSFSEEMKKSQTELDDFLLELDEDLEGLQSTVCFLQQQLRESKDQIQKLQKENEELSTLSGRPPVNHHFVIQEDHREFKVEHVKEESPIIARAVLNNDSSSISVSSMSPKTPDLNRTEEMMNPKPSRGTNSGRPWSPPPLSTINETEEPKIENHQKSEVVEEERHPVKQLSPLHKAVNQEPTSVIENAVNTVPSHLITIPAVRGSLHVEEYDSEQETEPVKAVEDNSVSLGNTLTPEVDETRVPVIVEPQQIKGNLSTEKPQPATNKRTTENCNSSRGRKRTRGSKLVTTGHNDDSVSEQPTVKRLRRREIIVEHDIQDSSECKRTPLDIDNTDTEVEVAQTLVNLAAAKKERKDLHNNSQDMLKEALGNGELLKAKSNTEKA